MSTTTITASPAFDDFDAFLAFAAATRDFDRGDLPAPDLSLRRGAHRPARGAADKAAIEQSLRGEA